MVVKGVGLKLFKADDRSESATSPIDVMKAPSTRRMPNALLGDGLEGDSWKRR